MALVPCVECGRGISEKAKVCPQCGYPFEEMEFARIEKDESLSFLKNRENDVDGKTEKGNNTLLMAAAIFMLLLALSFCSLTITSSMNNKSSEKSTIVK